ncbi:MAG: hypothetical protein H6R40_1545, partial [Gemmatimonadetes bacterium]|nr:hypothetical protein [Gemmatimonadota bacterium]
QLWGRWPKARGWWSRMLQGRVGRWVFRIAGVGQAKAGETEGRTGGRADTLDRLQALHVQALKAGDGLTANLRGAESLRSAVDAAAGRETSLD